MHIEQMRFRVIDIPFRTAFTHASATRSRAEGVWVEARSRHGAIGQGEGCPRDYVTGETVDTARAFFHSHRSDLARRIRDVTSLRVWVHENRDDIDANPAAWCAIELALLTVMAVEQGRSVEQILGLPAIGGEHRYSAILGDVDGDTFERQFDRYRSMGFTDFKLKTSGCRSRDRCKIGTLRKAKAAELRVRLDANNAWHCARDAISYLRSFEYPYFAVEEPLASREYRALERVGEALDTRIVLDESLTRVSQLAALSRRPEIWIINLRISKMGGLLRSIELAHRARELGIPLIVGAHVGETSLLARAALGVAGAAGPALLAREGAFGTYLLERDVCQSPVMFGRGGTLTVDACVTPGAPGFGLAMQPEWTTLQERAA